MILRIHRLLCGTSLLAIMTPPLVVATIADMRPAYAQTYTLSILAMFNGLGNGSEPSTALTFDSAGNLYGTTDTGGAFNQGTVFKIAAGSDSLSTWKHSTTRQLVKAA